MSRTTPLSVIRVKSPCPESWEAMTGDEKSRFCAGCQRHVHNLSAMPREEAERLICESAGRLCVRFEQGADGAPVNQYAQRVVSTPGKQDGLAWQAADGTWEGPVGEGVARAIAEGYSEQQLPYQGYYFKVLKGQGPSAPLGEMDFLVRGYMIGGFALVAAPAEYEVTGVMTFIVSHDGIVYERDLGPDTLDQFRAMERYNPDSGWKPVATP